MPHPANRELVRPEPDLETFVLPDDGAFPNSTLPILLYRRALELTRYEPSDAAIACESILGANTWPTQWRDSVYAFHHYHSTAHEALACCAGTAHLQLGGPGGPVVEVSRGDVLVMPAGVAHRRAHASAAFSVVGAYPAGQQYDMNRGRAGERPAADERIARVSSPQADPVYGHAGPLMRLWGTGAARAAE